MKGPSVNIGRGNRMDIVTRRIFPDPAAEQRKRTIAEEELRRHQETKRIQEKNRADRSAGVAWARAFDINDVGDALKDLDIKALRQWIVGRLDQEQPLPFIYAASDVLFITTKAWCQQREAREAEQLERQQTYGASDTFGLF